MITRRIRQFRSHDFADLGYRIQRWLLDGDVGVQNVVLDNGLWHFTLGSTAHLMKQELRDEFPDADIFFMDRDDDQLVMTVAPSRKSRGPSAQRMLLSLLIPSTLLFLIVLFLW